MEFVLQVVTSIIGASVLLFVVGILIGVRAAQRERRAREKTKQRISAFEAELENRYPEVVKDSSRFAPIVVSTSAAQAPSGYLNSESSLADLRRQIFDISDKVEKQRNEIVEVQRIDPVLEATLKAAIENLTKRIEALEKTELTKWDVAVVVLQLLGGIGIIVGTIFGILKYVSA
jgi:hypothetical protein